MGVVQTDRSPLLMTPRNPKTLAVCLNVVSGPDWANNQFHPPRLNDMSNSIVFSMSLYDLLQLQLRLKSDH